MNLPPPKVRPRSPDSYANQWQDRIDGALVQVQSLTDVGLVDDCGPANGTTGEGNSQGGKRGHPLVPTLDLSKASAASSGNGGGSAAGAGGAAAGAASGGGEKRHAPPLRATSKRNLKKEELRKKKDVKGVSQWNRLQNARRNTQLNLAQLVVGAPQDRL